jgi:MFS family permease
MSDRLGTRPIIIAGCALRSIGFGLFAVFNTIGGLLVATVLTGIAGALFAPAVRSYLAADSADQRIQAFSLFNLFGTTGTLLGPLVGAALLAVDFRVVALGAALIFTGLTIVQLFLLPAKEVPKSTRSLSQDWKLAFSDHRFLSFTLSASVLFTMQNQYYLTLPLEITTATGSGSASALVFLVSTIVTLTMQVRIVDWCSARWSTVTSISVGIAATAVAMLPMIIFTTLVGNHGRLNLSLLIVCVATIALTTGVLGFGESIAQPFINDQVGEIAPVGLSGTYFGIFSTASGIIAAVMNIVIGYLSDLGRDLNAPELVWLALFALAGAGALGVHWHARRQESLAYRSL